jgi:hypothetical protein
VSSGVKEESIEASFRDFKEEKKKAKNKTKSLYIIWKNFLNKNCTKKENTGTAANIVFSLEMKEFSTSKGFTKDAAFNEFENFKDYYVSKRESRVDWVAAWRSWVRRSRNSSKAWEVKADIENKYYVGKLVSGEIIKLINKMGVSPSDVIRGKVPLADIEVVSVPVPASMGKGTESIFMFKDKIAQNKAVEGMLGGGNDKGKQAQQRVEYIEAMPIEEIING